MNSYYINKSIKGNSIISNLNVENSFITNTHITNEIGSTYDIGSSQNPFRVGYFTDLNIGNNTLQNYTKSLFSSTNPINYTDGNISLDVNISQFNFTNDELNINDNYITSLFTSTNPITYTDGLIGLNVDTSKLEIVANELSVKDSYTKSLFTTTNPITYTDGLIGIQINSSKLEIVANELSVKDSYTKSLFSATNPITYTDGLFGLDINTSKLEVVANELSVKDSYTKSLFSATNPITYTDGLIGLDINSTKLEIVANQLSVKDTYTKSLITADAPLQITDGNVSLNFDPGQFSIDGSNRLSFDYTTPFQFNASGLELAYNTQQFDLNSSQLNLKIDAPLSFDTGKLDLKLHQTLDTSGFTLQKLFVNGNGELDINLTDLLYAGNGISKLSYAEAVLGFGFGYVPGFGDAIPEIEFISSAIDPTVLDFKAGLISIKSQGISRVPYFSAFTLTSDSSFYFNDALNELVVDRITLTDTVSSSSLNNRATTKAYVDNLNTYASTSALFYTQDGSTRVWDIKLNPDFLGLDGSERLITKITGAPNKAISVSPDNKIILSYNVNHFREAPDGKLESALITKVGSCLVLDPNYDLDIDIELADFVVIAGKLGLSSVFKGKVTTLETKMTASEGAITTLQGQITPLITQVASNTASIVGLTATVSAQGVIDAIHAADLAGLHAFIDGNILPVLDTLGADINTINSSLADTTGTGSFVKQTSPNLITPVLGVASGTSLSVSGNVNSLTHTITGSTSGVITIQGQAVAGTYNFNLPTTSGTAGQVLTSQGGGVSAMIWSTPTTGTVSSVAVSVPSFLSVSGSPITTSGIITLGLSGVALPVLNGGTGSTTATGTGSVVLQNSPNLITPNIGVASGTSLNVSGNVNSLTHTITGSTSGVITIQGQAVAGTYNFNLPTTSGTAGQVLTSAGGGSNAMIWSTTTTGTSLSLSSTTASTSTTTGALTVAGGLGVGGNTFIGGYLSPLDGIVIQSGQDGGTSKGIYMWNRADTNWAIYMGTAGATRSIAGGTSVASPGFSSHSIRFRVAGSVATGFIFENNSEAHLMSLRADASLYLSGTINQSISGTTGQIMFNGLLPNLATNSNVSVMIGKANTTNNCAVIRYATTATPYTGLGFWGNEDIITYSTSKVVSMTGTTASTSTTTGALTVAGGLGVVDTIYSNGIDTTNNASIGNWSYIGANVNGIDISGIKPGFGFGWNQSSAQGENIMTYYTGAGTVPRFDLCSWNGTTRTVRMTMDAVGNSTFSGNLTLSGAINGESRAFRISNTSNGANAYAIARLSNDTNSLLIFLNSSTRTADGGVNTATIRNDAGSLRLQSSAGGSSGIILNSNGNVGIKTTTTNGELQFSNSVVNRKIVLFEVNNNDHEFFGFGINNSVLRYQTLGDHVFYNGTSSISSNELLRISSTGAISATGYGTGDTIMFNSLLPNLATNSKSFIIYGKANTTNNSSYMSYVNTTTPYTSFGFWGNDDIITYNSNRLVSVNSGTLQVVNDTTPSITVGTSGAGGGSLYFGNSGHGVRRVGNDVNVYTNGGTSVRLQTDGVDRIITNSSNTTINGPLIINSTFRSTVNWACYRMTGDSGWPNATDTVCRNWYVLSTSGGEALSLENGGDFMNRSGRDLFVTITWTTSRASNTFGDSHFWIDSNGYRWAKHDTSGVASACVSATVGLGNNVGFQLFGWQTSGSGNNFHSVSSMATVVIHH